MGLFDRAVKTKTASAPKKKNTTWSTGAENKAVSNAVHQLVALTAEEKAIKAKMGLYKGLVEKFARENYVQDLANLGVQPPGPLKITNSDGESVTYVVQDRSSQYNVKEEQRDMLVELVGEDEVEDLLYTETTISFDRSIMAIPGVSDAIESYLERCITKLIKEGTLSPEQADELVVAQQKTAFKPGTLDRVVMIVGKSANRVSQFLDAMGSCCVRYIKT